MSRTLINILGVVATLGVLALGIVLVAMPLAFQALGVVGQTASVVSTNATYQAQIDGLREEEEHLDVTQASVASLETQITPAGELDDVFEVIAKAAEATGVTITSVTAGESVPFVQRLSSTTGSEVAEVPVETPAADATTEATATDAAAGAPAQASASTGRTQVDFAISVTASDLNQVVAFLDALRGGPRLLGQIQSTVSATATGFDVAITALTFVLPQEG